MEDRISLIDSLEDLVEEAKKLELGELESFIENILDKSYKTYDDYPRILVLSALAAVYSTLSDKRMDLSGFQAQFVPILFYRYFMREWGPIRLQLLDELIYPQYEGKFKSHNYLSKGELIGIYDALKKAISVNIDQNTPSENVVEHWRFLLNGNLPFGFKFNEMGEDLCKLPLVEFGILTEDDHVLMDRNLSDLESRFSF